MGLKPVFMKGDPMVEQICEKCGARYSMYAPACPKCGAPSTQPAKKPGCPQAPAPAPKPAKAAPATPKQPEQGSAIEKASGEISASPAITVEGKGGCPCRKLAASPLALIGMIAAVFGIFKLLKK